jgi:broad specificity phosphatase PhoE
MNPFIESSAALDSRVQGALARAASTVPQAYVAAVMTHGAVLAAILSISAEIDSSEPAEMRCGNLEVLEIAVDPAKGWRVRRKHSPLDLG